MPWSFSVIFNSNKLDLFPNKTVVPISGKMKGGKGPGQDDCNDEGSKEHSEQGGGGERGKRHSKSQAYS